MASTGWSDGESIEVSVDVEFEPKPAGRAGETISRLSEDTPAEIGTLDGDASARAGEHTPTFDSFLEELTAEESGSSGAPDPDSGPTGGAVERCGSR